MPVEDSSDSLVLFIVISGAEDPRNITRLKMQRNNDALEAAVREKTGHFNDQKDKVIFERDFPPHLFEGCHISMF